MDSIELPQILFSEIRKLRRNPISSAAIFLDSTRCFRHSLYKTLDHIQEFCGFDLIKEIILKRQLFFLQKMTIEMDSTRGAALWKKEAVLKIFAKWCHQNSHGIHLTPWQCLAREMTLFDVVYLDILHGFDVPNNVLLEYVDREWSAEVVCKLACCYSMKPLKREDRKNKVEYSLHFKTLFMFRQAISYKHPTIESIKTSVSILMRCKEYEMAAKVLESAIHDCSSELMRGSDFYADMVSHKMKNDMQEISDLRVWGEKRSGTAQSIQSLIYFSLSVCYKYFGDEKHREVLLDKMSVIIKLNLDKERDNEHCVCLYPYFSLMLEVFENSKKWKNLHSMIYRECVSKET